ncbi:MAG: hypothetical protein ACFFD4_08340 [Candidatus Odinarchaeota archaeon]
MYRNKDHIDQELQRCIRELREIALEDEEITPEEKALLDKIEEDFTQLEKQLFQVLESNLDDEEFQELLLDFLNHIADNAFKVAYEDGIISPDEQKLLDKIKDFINKGGAI